MSPVITVYQTLRKAKPPSFIVDSNNKELERGNKINVNQIRSMENRFCQTKLTSFFIRLQV